LGANLHTTKKNTETLLVASKNNELEVNADKISAWSVLEIRMQDVMTISRLIVNPLNEWNSSNNWVNPNKLKFYSGRN
jgi:hypothetical protein